MYTKAVQISPTLLAFAYELSRGGYTLAFCHIGYQPILKNEPEFETLEALEHIMKEFAPLSQWSASLFYESTDIHLPIDPKPSPIFVYSKSHEARPQVPSFRLGPKRMRFKLKILGDLGNQKRE